jgi:transcriptional regulator with XRE-family HTH domain
MPTSDFSVFRDRLAEACHMRGMTHENLCSSIGLGGRRTIDILYSGLRALDIERLAQIADRLDVSIDWLLGRTNVMGVMEMPEPPKRKAKKPKA